MTFKIGISNIILFQFKLIKFLLIRSGHPHVELEEGELYDFVDVADEGVEDAGGVAGVEPGEVGRREAAAAAAVALVDDAITG